MSGLLHGLLSVVHALSLECPGAEPVGEIFECLQTLGTPSDLGGVVASEKGVRGLVHFFRCYTETNYGIINDSVIFERPQVVKFFLAHVFVRGEPEDTVGVVAEALRLVEGEELEVSALLLFELEL